MNILDLPPDIHSQILELLTINDRHEFASVSKKTHQIVAMFYENTTYGRFSKFLEWYNRNLTQLEKDINYIQRHDLINKFIHGSWDQKLLFIGEQFVNLCTTIFTFLLALDMYITGAALPKSAPWLSSPTNTTNKIMDKHGKTHELSLEDNSTVNPIIRITLVLIYFYFLRKHIILSLRSTRELIQGITGSHDTRIITADLKSQLLELQERYNFFFSQTDWLPQNIFPQTYQQLRQYLIVDKNYIRDSCKDLFNYVETLKFSKIEQTHKQAQDKIPHDKQRYIENIYSHWKLNGNRHNYPATLFKENNQEFAAIDVQPEGQRATTKKVL